MKEENEEIDAQEIVDTPSNSTAIAFVPGSLADLSNRKEEGMAIIRARSDILEFARKAAIKMTSPEDWLLFKDPQGREVGYLQDCGCDRVRDIFGISVFDVSIPEKIPQSDGSFLYLVTGSGRCALTQQTVERVEGGRKSTDDFITRAKPPLTGAAMELAVRKAARANLDGNLVRELSGLNSVPREEIEAVYQGNAAKTGSRFRLGRGFGTQSERSQQGEMAPDQVEAPKCPKCNVPMVLRKGTGRNGAYAFYGCTNFKSKDCKETIQESDWLDQLAEQKLGGNSNGFTKAGDVAATFAPEIVKLGGLIAQLQAADKSFTADKICAEFLTIEGTAYKYEEIKTWKSKDALKWVVKAIKEIEKKYGNILPPKPTKDEPQQEGLPL